MKASQPDDSIRPSTADTSPRPTAVDFEALYSAELDPMLRLATLLCGSTTVAEDVVADSFARVLPRLGQLDRPGAYLRRCVVNGSIGWRRRMWRHAGPPIVEPASESTDSERAELADALAALPPRQRAAVVLRYWAGLSEAETAEHLGCRAGTVGSLAHRGLTALRVELHDHEEGGR